MADIVEILRPTITRGPAQLTIHDHGDEGPNYAGIPENLAYPDWNEQSTFTIVGPIGDSKWKGMRFVDLDSAVAHFEALHGKSVEAYYWPSPTGEGGKYGLRFRKKANAGS